MGIGARSSAIDRAIEGSGKGRFFFELFSNSALFPIANILLELLIDGPGYLVGYRFYVLCAGAVLQAWYLSRTGRTPATRFAGNLIAPLAYTASEVFADGLKFFAAPHHLAYWGFAAVIGALQAVRGRGGRLEDFARVAEGLVRSMILLVMYAIFEKETESPIVAAKPFFADPTHVFMAWAIALLGLIGGIAAVTSQRYLALLQDMSRRFRLYSEWLLGPALLEEAVSDPARLALKRLDRALLFMDVRAFTAWSEGQTPEAVVDALDAYYRAAEASFERHPPIRYKFVADEVMAVFEDPGRALDAARALADDAASVLASHGLGAGIGLHWGPVVEGLMGGVDVKHFDVIGDTVNTAKRIEGAASGGEILLSEAFRAAAGLQAPTPMRSLVVKGKSAPLAVHVARAA
jgi:class 3 adenylate cyclase